jgi:hypothetical protein
VCERQQQQGARARTAPFVSRKVMGARRARNTTALGSAHRSYQDHLEQRALVHLDKVGVEPDNLCTRLILRRGRIILVVLAVFDHLHGDEDIAQMGCRFKDSEHGVSRPIPTQRSKGGEGGGLRFTLSRMAPVMFSKGMGVSSSRPRSAVGVVSGMQHVAEHPATINNAPQPRGKKREMWVALPLSFLEPTTTNSSSSGQARRCGAPTLQHVLNGHAHLCRGQVDNELALVRALQVHRLLALYCGHGGVYVCVSLCARQRRCGRAIITPLSPAARGTQVNWKPLGVARGAGRNTRGPGE